MADVQTGQDSSREITRLADRLPTLPAVAIEILQLTHDPSVSIDQLISVVSRDPALAVRLLRLANSSVFRRGEPVTTLLEAALRLGLKTVKLMALSFSLTEVLPRNSEKGFDYGSYWRRSIVTTVAARTLARLVRCPYEDEAFLCGLLGRIGELVVAELGAPSAGTSPGSDRRAGPDPNPRDARPASEMFELGSQVLRHWDLPEIIWRSVRALGQPGPIPPDVSPAVRAIAQILAVADATAVFITGIGEGRDLALLDDLAARAFGFSAPQTEAFVVGLEAGIFETAMLLNTGVPCPEGHDALLERARQQLLSVSLDTVADLHVVSQRAAALERDNRELTDRLHIDPLTGLPDRARLETFLQAEIEERLAKRTRTPLALLMIDVDHFKQMNDSYGHTAGDQLLSCVAEALRTSVRAGSFVGRFGGDEFVAVLPGVGIEHLEGVAERIRLRVAEPVLSFEGRNLSATVSVGGICLRAVRSARAGGILVARADACLYEAKDAGRNCSVCREIDPV